MNRYGQAITWSTPGAPHPFSGICTSYTMRDALTRQLIDDESGDNLALVLHSSKADISFAARVTSDSTDFLDLSAGASITVTGIGSGVVLARRAVERWVLMQQKTASIDATWFPDIVQASPDAAGALDAFTPDQSALTIVTPGASIIFSTFNMGHASGVVHELTMTQELPITEDEPSPAGKILGAASHGYLRTIELLLLAKAAAPAKGTVLALTNAPDNTSNYRIEDVETRFAEKRGKMYAIRAVWIPTFA